MYCPRCKREHVKSLHSTQWFRWITLQARQVICPECSFDVTSMLSDFEGNRAKTFPIDPRKDDPKFELFNFLYPSEGFDSRRCREEFMDKFYTKAKCERCEVVNVFIKEKGIRLDERCCHLCRDHGQLKPTSWLFKKKGWAYAISRREV